MLAGEDEGFGVVSFRYIDTVDPAGGDIGRGIDGAATEAVGGARDLSGSRTRTLASQGGDDFVSQMVRDWFAQQA